MSGGDQFHQLAAGYLVLARLCHELAEPQHGEALAAVGGYDRYTELVQLRADLRDLALVLGRGADDDGTRHALDDVVDAFGRARRR